MFLPTQMTERSVSRGAACFANWQALHPDKVQVEEEKERRTEVMMRSTRGSRR